MTSLDAMYTIAYANCLVGNIKGTVCISMEAVRPHIILLQVKSLLFTRIYETYVKTSRHKRSFRSKSWPLSGPKITLLIKITFISKENSICCLFYHFSHGSLLTTQWLTKKIISNLVAFCKSSVSYRLVYTLL